MPGYKIADGHNESGNLELIKDLDPPNFSEYSAADGMKTEWRDYESRELNGNKTYEIVGLPSVDWIFFRLTPDEFDFLMTTFGDEVTIQTYNKTANSFRIFNATLLKPNVAEKDDATWDLDGWDEVRFRFIDLVDIGAGS